ncbi:MAG: restriction endonuclease subunit S [Bacteroidota bacterium]
MNSNLPKQWKVLKLGYLCKTATGGTPRRNNPNYYTGKIPWVKSGELDYNTILDTEEKITKDAIENSNAKLFPKGSILIALYGATIGKLAILGINATTNQAICAIYKSASIESKYLFHFLFSKKQFLVKQSFGGAQPNISQTILRNLDVPLPPLPEQHRIVAKIEELISDLDKGVESLKTAQQQLKTYRQSVLKWAFEGHFTNKNMKEGELPEGWKWVKFGDVHDIKSNLVDSLKYLDMPHIAPDNISKGIAKLLGYRTIREDKVISANHKFFKGQIVYSKIRPNLTKVIIAPIDGLCSADMYPIDSKYNNRYTLYYMLTNSFVKIASNTESRTILPKINQKGLNAIPFPLCPQEEQNQIVQEIESRLSVCDKLEETITANLQQCESLRQSILKKAFEGRLT